MDGIYLSGEANRYFSYDFKYASLGSMKLDSTYLFEGEDIDVISRYLSFHKFILTLKDYLRLSFSESCIFGRKSIGNIFDYTFPFFIFYGEQNNIDINDNILWAFDVNYNYLGRVNLSYSLLVDDYQYEYEGTKDLEPPELGHIVRIDAPVCCAVMSLSYMRINAWVYNQRYPWNRYIFNSKNIGDEMGPDIQGIEGNGLFAYSSTGRVNFKVSYFEKGDNYSSSDWIFPISDTYYYKQIGIDPVKKWTEASLSVEQIYKFLSFNLSLNYLYGIENTDSGLSVDSYIRILL
jgi:hypothetical protein